MAPASIVTALVAVLVWSVPGDDEQETVRLQARPSDEHLVAAQTVDGLSDGDVLVVRVTDGAAGARGNVLQCRLTVDGFSECTNRFPVQFGDDGAATFQYQLVDPGDCGATGACVVRVSDGDHDLSAHAFTVFGEPAPPPPEVTLSPAAPYQPGDRVTVTVTDVAPATEIRAAFCADECRDATTVVADAAGTAETTVVIGARCDNCGVVVVSAASSQVVETRFTAPPGPEYDLLRLVAGLTAAVLLLLIAWRVVVTVDWRPPSEAEAPELDVPIVE
jgi:hypothetical protein